MADEFKHVAVGAVLTQTEYEQIDSHTTNDAAQGDVYYHNGTGIRRLGAGTAGEVLVTAGAGANPFWGPDAWTSWNPVVDQNGTVAATNNRSRYVRVGKIIIANANLTITGAGSVGNNVSVTLPVNVADATGNLPPIGSFHFNDGGVDYAGICRISTTAVYFMINSTGYVGTGLNIALANNDTIAFTVVYEAA